ncbi:MAG: 4-hydroxy-tetrahydrodipicolinate synthase [Phycisphaerales bacterium]
MFSGAITALITPFRNGQLDAQRLRENVRFQIAQGIKGLVPCGTTGESPTLSHTEHDHVIELVVEAAASASGGEVPVIAGTGSNCTDEAVQLTQHAKNAGADATLQVNPYYNKPTQEGMYRHFMTIADLGLPVVLYNIPGRSAVTLTPQTVARLARHEKIVAIKEATGSMDIASEIAQLCGDKLTILSGDDSLTLPLMALGGKGVISVLSNLVPAQVQSLTDAALRGDWAAARAQHLKLFALCKAMFIETNPIPVKTAMAMAAMDTGELRLPLCEMDPANRAKLEIALKQHGVIA